MKLYIARILRNLSLFLKKIYILVMFKDSMEKKFIIILISIIISTGVLAQEPYVEFSEFECDDLGVLSFKAEYQWNGYKPGYTDLKDVKLKAVKGEKIIQLEGMWKKFKTEEFLQSEIKLNSPTAYFFSNKYSWEEGNYDITIDYSVKKDNILLFQDRDRKTVTCPEQREIVKIELFPKIEPEIKEKEEEKEEEPKVIPKAPSVFDKDIKAYNLYYLIGLLIVIFIISLVSMKLRKRPFSSGKKTIK